MRKLFKMVTDAILVTLLVLLGTAVWYGWSVEIGQPDGKFHLRLYQLPMQRLFAL